MNFTRFYKKKLIAFLFSYIIKKLFAYKIEYQYNLVA